MGKFHMMQISAGRTGDMEFEGPCYQSVGITFRVDDEGEFAYIGRLKVPIREYLTWVGNWCWDSITVTWVEAIQIINYLGASKTGGWHMSCGPDLLFEAFNERHAITPEEWKRNLEAE